MPKYQNDAVAVIILDYKKPEMTRDCIESILRYNDLSIYVVENESDFINHFDDLSWVSVIHFERNVGFSKGMNGGLNRAIADNHQYFLLLNNDSIVTSRAIELLVNAIEQNREIGLVTPNVKSFDLAKADTSQDSVRIVNRSFEQAVSTIELKSALHLRDLRMISGFCMAFRLDVILAVGLLDEDFQFGKEDDELSFRILGAGYRLVEVVDSLVYHQVNGSIDYSSGTSVRFLVYNMSRGRAVLARKLDMNRFVQLLMSVYECARTLIKVLLTEGDVYYRAFLWCIEGYKDGQRASIHPPPFSNCFDSIETTP